MIELLVSVAITAILATVAVPSFSGLIANQRAKTVTSELFGSLLKTRSEAIKRNASVTLSPTNAGGWVSGWRVLDLNGNVLDTRGASTGVTIAGPGGNPAPVLITYRPSGRLATGSAAPSFLVTATAGWSTTNQCVSVDLTGRPYIVAASTC
jgi:type IV fimbrial biogenesis protein FimT